MKLSKILVILLIVCLLFAGCKAKPSEQPEGSGETIEPAGDVTTLEDENYTYDKFLVDAQTITSKYPTKVQMGVFGKSAFNRELLYFAIGDKNATKKILVVAGVFGTESSLSLLATKQIETYLEDLTRTYKNKSYQQILDSCRIFFVPMLNPDGISIAQKGLEGVPEDKKAGVEAIYTYSVEKGLLDAKNGYSQWRANGLGVDLSMNFGVANVASNTVMQSAASKGYPEHALSSPEANAISGLIQSNAIDSVVVYNGTGNIIDWQFGQTENSIQQSIDIANELATLTGFSRVDVGGPTKKNFVTMGIKDWFIANLDKPAFTLSMGNPKDKISLNEDELKSVWNVTSLVPISLAWHTAYYVATTIAPNAPTPTGQTPTATPTLEPGRTPQVDYDYID